MSKDVFVKRRKQKGQMKTAALQKPFRSKEKVKRDSKK
jgi:hypothetical protein